MNQPWPTLSLVGQMAGYDLRHELPPAPGCRTPAHSQLYLYLLHSTSKWLSELAGIYNTKDPTS